MENIRVKVVHKNKDMVPVSEYNCSLREWTDAMRLDVLRLITDIEDLIYTVNGNKPKDDWGETEILIFNKVKHKILDKAGEIGRLPDNMYVPTAEESSCISFWESLFGNKKVGKNGKTGTEV